MGSPPDSGSGQQRNVRIEQKPGYGTATEGAARRLATGLENQGAVTRRGSTPPPSAMKYLGVLIAWILGVPIGFLLGKWITARTSED